MIDEGDQRSSTYHIGPRTLEVVYQDLATVDADVVVSSDDNYLTMGGGVSARLGGAGGPCVGEHARKLVAPDRPSIRRGDVVVTTAGALPARYLFHAVTLDLDSGQGPNEEVIEQATARAMELAESLAMTSIAFPALGTGVGGFPFQAAARTMIRTITVALDSSTSVERATIALFARPGVRQDELNAFYEDAVGQIALWQQTRRLADKLDRLAASGALSHSDGEAVRAVRDDLRAATIEDAAGDDPSVVDVLDQAGAALSELDPSEDEVADATLEQLRAEANAKGRLLRKLLTDRAQAPPARPTRSRSSGSPSSLES
jgi:O-acetyl-ADP-ribose deacetylase (regulator of RNase III)